MAHACGHDIHTSVGLGLRLGPRRHGARTSAERSSSSSSRPKKARLRARRGRCSTIREGALDDPRPAAIFALHSFPELADDVEGTVGRIGRWGGAAFAAVDQFSIEVRGKQSHRGAAPRGRPGGDGAGGAGIADDPLAHALAARASVVTVGIVRGGERFNIIPGAVHFEGTVRTYSEAARETVQRRMNEIADGITRAGGGDDLVYRTSRHPQRCVASGLGPAGAPAGPRSGERRLLATMAGEDFAYFANAVPGFYFRWHCLKPGTTSGGLHTPDFRADDVRSRWGSAP